MDKLSRKKSVAIIGLGYVGLPLALLTSSKGYDVIGIDITKEKVDLINKRIVPFVDEKLNSQIKATQMKATTDFSVLKNADIVVVCVPTPVDKNYKPDLGPIEGACKEIAKYLHKDQLVILESTVNPGVSEEVVLPLLEKGSKLKCGKDFHLAHCPERINPGDKKYDVSNISRVVGSTSEEGLKKAVSFYESIIFAPIKPMGTIKEAEAVKIVENCFRDVNIAFVNELAMSFDGLGIDIVNVIEGASTKPYSFMPHFPGCGVGGHCIAVDPYYLIEYAKASSGFEHSFLSLARLINNGMPAYTVKSLQKALKEAKIDAKSAKVAVLGLAYKGDIDDCRESPSFEVIKHLEEIGIKAKVYDPYVPKLSNVASLDDAVSGSDAVIIATAHKEFKNLKPEYFASRSVKVIIDGRNCLDKKSFKTSSLKYYGIGR